MALTTAWTLPLGAAQLPSTYCLLERSPALSWLRLANGEDCELDEDGNGLDDAVESELASCFVPELAFDSRENALRADEPHAFFSAYPLGPHAIRLHYAFLFARDGGYVLGTEFPCMSDEHDGDIESVEVDVAWTGRDGGFYGAPVAMRTSDPRDGALRVSPADVLVGGRTSPADGERAMKLSGTHPVLYATAGKHHSLHGPESLSYACDCGPLGRCGSVLDRADGAGPRIVPSEVRHAPGFYPAATKVSSLEAGGRRLRTHAPVDETGKGFWNACTFGARSALVPATRSLGSNDLTELGYPGEHLLGSCFRGGFGGKCTVTVSVAEALSWAKPFASGFGAKKLVGVLLGSSSDPTPTRTTVLLPFGSAPHSIWRY